MINDPELQNIMFMAVFTIPRMMAALSISPFFGDSFIQGMCRQVVIISMSIVAVPIVMYSSTGMGILPLDNINAWPLYLSGILIKEVAIGMLIGFITGVPFWIAEGTGFFIDNQRGSSMAEMFDPMSGGSSSPFGVLFTKVIGVLFFLGGGFSAFLTIIYESYAQWGVFSFFPTLSASFPETCLNLLDHIMGLIVTFAAPIVIAMFIAEFGLGLMNRFSPQLNVFFLAMPVKSGIASILIIFYLIFLVGFIQNEFVDTAKIKLFYAGLFK